MITDALLLSAMGTGFVFLFLLAMIFVIRLVGAIMQSNWLQAEQQPTEKSPVTSAANTANTQLAMRAAVLAAGVHYHRKKQAMV